MRAHVRTGVTGRGPEAGIALVLALLALMVLTFLGLTLAVTTSTELQIATNYRWSQQALYNAEAGLELAKRTLREIDWNLIVPGPRTTVAAMNNPPTPKVPTRPGPNGEPSRNLEMIQCDTLASGGWNQGYGVVLDDPSMAFPYQNVANFLGRTLAGNFTVWIRRPPDYIPGCPPECPVNAQQGTLIDYDPQTSWANTHQCAGEDCLIVTAEGSAPFVGAVGATQFARQRRAVRLLEVMLTRVDPDRCRENRPAQAGGGPAGAGYDPCDPVRFQGVPSAVGESANVQ